MGFRKAVCRVGALLVLSLAVGCAADGPPADSHEAASVTFEVSGMTCQSCEQAIEHTLGQLPGVESVEAHHDPGEAKVTFDTSQVTQETLIASIEGLGYSVVSSS